MFKSRLIRGLFLFGLSLFVLWIGFSVRNAFANPQLWLDVNEADIVLQGERRIIPDRYRTLALNTESVLAVLGAKSTEVSPVFGKRQELLLAWLPKVEAFILPDATHLLHVQNPRAMAAGLAAFFARHPLSTSR